MRGFRTFSERSFINFLYVLYHRQLSNHVLPLVPVDLHALLVAPWPSRSMLELESSIACLKILANFLLLPLRLLPLPFWHMKESWLVYISWAFLLGFFAYWYRLLQLSSFQMYLRFLQFSHISDIKFSITSQFDFNASKWISPRPFVILVDAFAFASFIFLNSFSTSSVWIFGPYPSPVIVFTALEKALLFKLPVFIGVVICLQCASSLANIVSFHCCNSQ